MTSTQLDCGDSAGAGNAPSKRVLEKAGFSLEGIMRSCYVKDETIVNAALYARIAPSS